VRHLVRLHDDIQQAHRLMEGREDADLVLSRRQMEDVLAVDVGADRDLLVDDLDAGVDHRLA
jgi:hypothetical protein